VIEQSIQPNDPSNLIKKPFKNSYYENKEEILSIAYNYK